MSKAAFKQADVERVCKGIIAAGLPIASVEYNDNGFVVLVGETPTPRRRNNAHDL